MALSEKRIDELYLSDDRYLAALERQRSRIAAGTPLQCEDSNVIGDKHTECSWGLCSDDKEAWPDAADHLWPDQFQSEGRVAPKYRRKGQFCPFDRRDEKQIELLDTCGCYYRCMVFRPKGAPIPDGKRALQLYDEKIAKVRAKQ